MPPLHPVGTGGNEMALHWNDEWSPDEFRAAINDTENEPDD